MSEETKTVSDQRKPVRDDIITQQDIDDLVHDLEEVFNILSNQAPRRTYEEALAMADRLADALLHGEPDYNSAWNMICLMAEGEGSDWTVYHQMAKAIHSKLKPSIADFRKWREGR